MDKIDSLSVRVEIPPYYPDEAKQQMLQAARVSLGNKLFNFLWEHKLPVVMDVDEIIINGHKEAYEPDIIEYKVRATSVEHMHVVIASPQELNTASYYKSLSFWDKIKTLIGLE